MNFPLYNRRQIMEIVDHSNDDEDAVTMDIEDSYVVIDDGRLDEEQPGVVWNPPGGERVARSASRIDTDDAGSEASIGKTDFQNGASEVDDDPSDRSGMLVSKLISRQFLPGVSLGRNLERSVEYLSSEEFLDDLASSGGPRKGV